MEKIFQLFSMYCLDGGHSIIFQGHITHPVIKRYQLPAYIKRILIAIDGSTYASNLATSQVNILQEMFPALQFAIAIQPAVLTSATPIEEQVRMYINPTPKFIQINQLDHYLDGYALMDSFAKARKRRA